MAKPRKQQKNAVLDQPFAALWDEMVAPYAERTRSRVVIGMLLLWAMESRSFRDDLVRLVAQTQAVGDQRMIELVNLAKSGELRKLIKRMAAVFDQVEPGKPSKGK